MTTAPDQDARLTELERRVARLELELTGARPILLEIRELVDGLPRRLDRLEERLDSIEAHLRRGSPNGGEP